MTATWTPPVLPPPSVQPTRIYTAFLADANTIGFNRPRLALASPAVVDFQLDKAMKRSMPGWRWNREHQCWSWPLTTAGCRTLREVLGQQMEVHPELDAWYRITNAREQAQERERAAALEKRRRVQEEESALKSERALYGVGTSAGQQSGMGSNAESVDVVIRSAVEVARIPIPECDAVSQTFIDGPFPPRPMQLDGAAWLSTNGSGVLADEVGLGKTLICLLSALDGERALAGPHLIVAPLKPARLTWPEEIGKWAPQAVMLAWEPGKSGAMAELQRDRALKTALKIGEHGSKSRPVFVVINHHAAAKYLDRLAEIQWASIVVDEANEVLSIGHRGGGTDTKNAQALMRLQTQEQGVRIACTGTPFMGRLRNVWGLVDWCHPGAAGDHREFVSTYTSPVSEHGGGASLDRVADGMEGHWSRFMQDWVLRRTRTAEERAMVNPIVEFVEPSEEQKAEDQRWAKRDLWNGVKMDTDGLEVVGQVWDEKKGRMAGGAMVKIGTREVVPDVILAVARRIQLSVGMMDGIDDESIIEKAPTSYRGPSPKVDRIMELLDGWGLLEPEWWHLAGEHGKVIIASPWTAGLDLVQTALLERLPPSSITRIDGSESPARIDAAKVAFSSARGPGILLLSSTAGGSGLTLDQHCCRLVFLSEHWTADVQEQVIGRINNRTWQTAREVIYMRSAGMIDEYVAARTKHQDGSQQSLMELAHAG